MCQTLKRTKELRPMFKSEMLAMLRCQPYLTLQIAELSMLVWKHDVALIADAVLLSLSLSVCLSVCLPLVRVSASRA